MSQLAETAKSMAKVTGQSLALTLAMMIQANLCTEERARQVLDGEVTR
jgi:hypothetical protein